MSVIWHLVKKDLRRLRLPLALFSLVVAGKLVFYAAISGLLRAPDIDWLRRIMNGPELLLRGLVEPVMAYLLAGWLVFEDSPVENDAHWITRPISGGQLFTAKLAGAILMFVLWPVVLNLPWWAACGFGASEIAGSAAQLAAVSLLLVAAAVTCASLTDGFPRFILWSLVGLGAFVMAQMILAPSASISPDILASRMWVCGLVGAGATLAVAGHQFTTRRHRKSLALLAAAVVLTGVVGGAWRWGFTSTGSRLAAERPESAGVAVQVAGPVRARQTGRLHSAEVPLQIAGLPEGHAVGRVNLRGDWSFAGKPAWFSQAGFFGSALLDGTTRQLLGMPPAPLAKPRVALPFSPAMAERAAREHATLRAAIDLELFRGRIMAELPLRAAPAQTGTRTYSISYLSTGPLDDTRGRAAGRPAPKSPQNVVSFLFTDRLAGMGSSSRTRNAFSQYQLVNRRTGEIFAPDQTRSGPEAMAVMHQATVSCWRMTYLVGEAPVRLEDLTLAVVRFDRGELLHRDLKVEPVSFVGNPVEKAEPAATPAQTGTVRMAELVRAHAAGDRFMGSVLVAKGDAVLLSESAGWAEVRQKTANTADTRFRIGSLTKQFTAAAILLLEEDGRLKVDDPLARFVPDIPETWRAVTLRQLLTHTSGIPNFTDLPGFQAWRQEPRSPAETMALLRDLPLDFAPGEKFKYSNSGYVLLGWVVELASGRGYEAFLRERIFGPLGMKDSGCDTNAPSRPQHATGYVPGKDRPTPAFLTEMQGPGGAGVLYSTAPDLLRWTQGLFGGKLLKPASLEQMTTPAKNGYAFGLGVSTADGRKSFSHAGAIDGFVSVLSYYPEDKVTVAVLANISGAPVAELGRQLTEVAFGKAVILVSERKEIAVPAAELERLVGVYQLTPRITTTIRLTDGQLTLQLTGQPVLPLFPESGKKFFGKLVDVQVEFVTDDQGRVTHLLQMQGGRTLNAPRISDTVVERTAITLPRATLQAYVGVYELRPDFTITITLDPDRDQLLGQGTGQQPAPLFAETETKFFSKVVDAQAEFVKDANGVVTHLILHQGGRDTPARRLP